MNARTVGRIEMGVELVASALFAGAVAFAAYTLLETAVAGPQLAILAGAAAAAAFELSSLVMRAGRAAKSSFAAPAFDLPDLEPFESDELLLSEEDRLVPEPLLLDDVLAEMGPESRVVRLFDRKAMPTAGQLQSQIDDHLYQRSAPQTPPDASQALSDALAELRRSLR
jgi:hypothetical protein